VSESVTITVADGPASTGTHLHGLLPALQRLDHLLAQAIAAAQRVYGPEAARDAFRGLHISQDDVARLLARQPGAPTLRPEAGELPEAASDDRAEDSSLDWLASAFGLSPFDLDVVMIALAPELDLRYERLYAYLQDDVTRRRPSVDLVLNLLCPSADSKLARRTHFASDAPLIRYGVIRVIPDPNHFEPPLLSHSLKLDEQIVCLLLGQDSLDSRLAPFCQIIEPAVSLDELPLAPEFKRALRELALRARDESRPLRLYFRGSPGAGQRRTAEALAGEVGTRLLAADITLMPMAGAVFERTPEVLFREAWFRNAILFLDGLDAIRGDDGTPRYQRLTTAMAEHSGITVLAGTQPWIPTATVGEAGPIGVTTVPFPTPDFAQRRDCWTAGLISEGIPFDSMDLDTLADRFRLTPDQIATAVATARNLARWRSVAQAREEGSPLSPDQPTLGDLLTAARAQSGHGLARLAHKVKPFYGWDDIVLPADTLAQLREICQRVAHRHQVLGEWGFDAKLSLGKGVNALFAGPSGTGKTMAAEILASELGLDLYKIDLSGVVSKWIGETEKNLDRIFTAAENANAILFFDEADALFGKRSEVRDSHDRYANLEISFLLQKMEQYEGIAILATNLRANLEEAFVRRLAFIVHFPFPDEVNRRRIWNNIWPAATPLSADLDLDIMARQFKLSGGNIKNIAMAAAFLAAEALTPVTMALLLHATRREYQKLGKLLSLAELNGSRVEGGSLRR
jgi:AAA+ superfamily predicted ATPase